MLFVTDACSCFVNRRDKAHVYKLYVFSRIYLLQQIQFPFGTAPCVLEEWGKLLIDHYVCELSHLC